MIYLASQSPRRAELLAQLQRSFETLSVEVDETPLLNEAPQDYVERLAIAKAKCGATKCPPTSLVIGSDTTVVAGTLASPIILGKPEDFDQARQMWRMLSNQTHRVMTAVAAVKDDKEVHCTVITEVEFAKMSEQQMQWYWQTQEPWDKAGGYGIQGLGGQFVKHIKGSYSAVVGLPLYETQQLIEKLEGSLP